MVNFIFLQLQYSARWLIMVRLARS